MVGYTVLRSNNCVMVSTEYLHNICHIAPHNANDGLYLPLKKKQVGEIDLVKFTIPKELNLQIRRIIVFLYRHFLRSTLNPAHDLAHHISVTTLNTSVAD